MSKDIEETIFLSLEKYYGKPKKNNRTNYNNKYRYKCRVCKYLKDYRKAWDRFSEFFDKYYIH